MNPPARPVKSDYAARFEIKASCFFQIQAYCTSCSGLRSVLEPSLSAASGGWAGVCRIWQIATRKMEFFPPNGTVPDGICKRFPPAVLQKMAVWTCRYMTYVHFCVFHAQHQHPPHTHNTNKGCADTCCLHTPTVRTACVSPGEAASARTPPGQTSSVRPTPGLSASRPTGRLCWSLLAWTLPRHATPVLHSSLPTFTVSSLFPIAIHHCPFHCHPSLSRFIPCHHPCLCMHANKPRAREGI